MSTTEQPVAVIYPKREGLPGLTLTMKEFAFVAEVLYHSIECCGEEELAKHVPLFFQGTKIPGNITRRWAEDLEGFANATLVQESFDSIETKIIWSNSYDILFNFQPGTRIDFVLQSAWALLFKTLIEVLKQGGGVRIEKLY